MNANSRLPVRAILFAFPALPFAMLAAPAISIIPQLYTRVGSLPITQLGIVLLVIRVATAIFELLAGFILSGARNCMLEAAILLTSLSAGVAFYQWVDLTRSGIDHFTIWALAVAGLWALFGIAHRVWIVATTRLQEERVRYATWRTIMTRAGAVICLLYLGMESDAHDVSPASLRILAVIGACGMMFGAFLFWLSAKGRAASSPDTIRSIQGVTLGEVFKRQGVGWLTLTTALQNAASGMTAVTLYYYMADIVTMTGHVAHVLLTGAVAGVVIGGAIPKVIKTLGARRVMVLSQQLTAVLLAGFAMVFLAPAAGWLVYVIFALAAFAASGAEVSQLVLVTQIAQCEDGPSPQIANVLFSATGFIGQSAFGAGSALGLAVFALGHFGADGATATNSSSQISLVMAFAIIPATLRVASAYCACRLPNMNDDCT